MVGISLKKKKISLIHRYASSS